MAHAWMSGLALSICAAPVVAQESAPAEGGFAVDGFLVATYDEGWTKGAVELQSIGPLTFGPEGVLFVGDPEGAAIYAIATGDRTPKSDDSTLDSSSLSERIAQLTGTKAGEVRIHDLAVNPASGRAYLSVTRGGDSEHALVVRVSGSDAIEVLDLADVSYMRAELDNVPAPGGSGRRNQRAQSITDLEFQGGKLFVAGLSNEEFASKLRCLAFPFEESDGGTSVEVYHGAHGAWETRSPVRTFLPMNIGGKPHLVCGYTCTPLVKFPIEELLGGEKIIGTTVAELGNRNTPLDMVLYEKGGEEFLLIANTSRGVMKLATKGIDTIEGLTERVEGGGRAGLGYETVADLADVTQLAKLDDLRALVLIEPEGRAVELRTVVLP